MAEATAKTAVSDERISTTDILSKPDLGSLWRHEMPEEHGLGNAALQSLHRRLADTRVVAAVIVRDGVIIDEYYKPGYASDSVFALNSCSKSITSALLGIAIEQGYIDDVSVRITQYFPQILQSDSEYRKQINI